MADEPAASTADTGPAPNAAGLVQQNSSPIPFDGEGRPAWLPPEVTDDTSFRAWYDKGTQGAAFSGDAPTEAPKLDEDGNPIVDPNAPKEAPTEEAPSDLATEEPKTTEEAPKEFTPDPRTDDQIKASLKEAGGLYADQRYEAAALEFAKTGTVSAETLATTATAFGVTPEIAKTVFDAQRALVEANGKLAQGAQTTQVAAQDAALSASLSKIVPADADYNALLAWGKGALTEAEMSRYNKALDEKDTATVEALLPGFYDRFKASGNGPRPRDITTEATPAAALNQGPRGFKDDQEMNAAIADPRYNKDTDEGARYRAGVMARIKVSMKGV